MSLSVRISKENIGLSHPFEYYLEKLDYLPYARIEITTPDGVLGKGEIACSLDANGESALSAMALAEPIQAILGNISLETEGDVFKALQMCELHFAFNRATKCGLEQALFDIVAQRKQVSMGSLLGATYRPAKIQCTIPYRKDAAEYEEHFAKLLLLQPEHVKFKLGKNLDLESKMIVRFRELAPSVGISVDANQAFATAESAQDFLAKVSSAGLCWAEQMLPREDVDAWKQLKKIASVPLMADESIHTAREARWYLENGLVDFINIKLAKAGGVLEARKIFSLAEEYRVPAMLGSMLHGELGLRYNLAFGLSKPFVTYDFFSYFSLEKAGEPALIDSKTLRINEAVLT